MANDDFPRGLVPYTYGAGRAVGRYYLASTAADLFLGQPVSIAADGRVADAGTGGFGTVLGVVVGVAAGPLVGGNIPGVGGFPASDVGIVPKPYYKVADLAGGVTGYVFVTDDPMQEYIVQEATNGSTRLQLVDVGAAVNLRYRGATITTVSGNILSGWAALEADAATNVSTTAGGYMLMGMLPITNQDGTQATTGNYAKWIVRIIHHQRLGPTVTAQV